MDPAWDRDTKLPSVEEAIKTQFDVINAGLTREEQEARLDVRYQKPSGKHVIIELKRGDRTVKFIELIAQVDKYFSALTKILKKHDTDEDFEIIVLLGKRLDGEKVDHDIESKHLRQLAEVNTRILYYDQLLAKVISQMSLDNFFQIVPVDNLFHSLYNSQARFYNLVVICCFNRI